MKAIYIVNYGASFQNTASFSKLKFARTFASGWRHFIVRVGDDSETVKMVDLCAEFLSASEVRRIDGLTGADSEKLLQKQLAKERKKKQQQYKNKLRLKAV